MGSAQNIQSVSPVCEYAISVSVRGRNSCGVMLAVIDSERNANLWFT